MKCYSCGEVVSDSNTCRRCGANVRMLRKARAISNLYYNDGLERAKVRDLSGAIVSLRESLKYNKENIDARNLLGLVYLETGEVVEALSEWVLSKNFQPDMNRADKYLAEIQKNSVKLDTINQTIKKYNQALLYCRQDSIDLAIIQLKKVLSLNPKLIKGHNLLALLYITQKKYDKAEKTLKKALRIDKTGPVSLRYLAEAEKHLRTEGASGKLNVQKDKNKLSYQSGNETIIQPVGYKETTGMSSVINLIIGFILGACVIWFLVVPGIKQGVKDDNSSSMKEASETIADKNTKISELESDLKKANEEITRLNETIANDGSASASYEALFNAEGFSKNGDYEKACDEILAITESLLSDQAKETYNELKSEVVEKTLPTYYSNANDAYNNGDYDEAIVIFEKIIKLDDKYESGNAMYYLAESYRLSENKDKAKETYQRVIDLFPDTQICEDSKGHMSEISE